MRQRFCSDIVVSDIGKMGVRFDLALLVLMVATLQLVFREVVANEMSALNAHVLEDLNVAQQAIMQADHHLMDIAWKCSSAPLYYRFIPVDCEEVLRQGYHTSGVYTVYPGSRLNNGRPMDVYCDMNTDGGGWTVIQRRGDFGREMDYFFKGWDSYETGFGDIEQDFWLGNKAIYALSNQRQYSVRFDLSDFEGNCAYAVYDTFWIDNAGDDYRLHIKDYTGTAGDSMKEHDGQPFMTKSEGNNDDLQNVNCADYFKGAWWYKLCHLANLNGLYRRGAYNDTFADGVVWYSWKGFQYSLKTTEIKIRPKKFSQSEN